MTQCNCLLCRSYGVIWIYCDVDKVSVSAEGGDTYAWNGRNVDFYRCHFCGCVTHWTLRDTSRVRRGIKPG